MIGERFWSTGITVRYGYAGSTYSATGRVERYGWRATRRFLDDGFVNDNFDAGLVATQGELNTRYYVGDLTGAESGMAGAEAHTRALTVAIDTVKRDAEAMGIHFGTAFEGPTIYAEGDGEDPQYPLPDGWCALVNAQAERLGWRPTYDVGMDLNDDEADAVTKEED